MKKVLVVSCIGVLMPLVLNQMDTPYFLVKTADDCLYMVLVLETGL